MHRIRFPAVVQLLCLSGLRLQQSILALACCGYCQVWPCKPVNCQVVCDLSSVSDFLGCHMFHASDPGQAPHVTIAQRGAPHSSAPLHTFIDLVCPYKRVSHASAVQECGQVPCVTITNGGSRHACSWQALPATHEVCIQLHHPTKGHC